MLLRSKSALKTTPKDIFLHLLMMAMLYIGIISLIMISFAYIDYWYPDIINNDYSGSTLDSIRYSSSMLIVSAPLLILLAWFIQRDLRKTPKKHELTFSKWLVYITLFISAITIVIDLAQIIYRFYGGDLTLPFVLKLISILIFAGAVFGYYVWEVQHEPQKSKVPATIGWIYGGAVIGMLILGFVVVGSPMKQREIRMDEKRINDLQTVQNEIINYWQYKEVLPASLNELKNDITGFAPPLDPETNQPYEYVVLEPLKFKLCTTFTYPYPLATMTTKPTVTINQNWNHEAGQHCFERAIDPALFPKPLK